MRVSKSHLDEGALDWLQTGLDIAGIIPGIGEGADGLNAGISIARGRPLEALLSAISMIPGAGDAVGKGGKIVLKILDPVMDAIKAGKKAGPVLKKLGPKRVKQLKKPLAVMKDTVAKHEPTLGKLFKAVKEADLEALEKAAGFKVPSVARGKSKKALEKVSNEMDIDGLKKLIEFIKDSADNMSSGDEPEEKNEMFSPRGYPLAEGSMLAPALFGDEYVNEKLESLILSLDEAASNKQRG